MPDIIAADRPSAIRIAIVGTGEMGAMLVRAHARYGDPEAFVMQVANRSRTSLQTALSDAPGAIGSSLHDVGRDADVVFLCVPAEVTLTLAAELRPQLLDRCVVVTIASGVRMEDLAAVLPQPLVRMTPNVGHEFGRGACLITAGPRASQNDLKIVQDFVAPFSEPVFVTDHDARIAIDITSCGPAILARLMETVAAVAAARAENLTTAETMAMVRQTVMTVSSLLEAGRSTADICKAVATPGGTTEAALDAVESIASQGIGYVFDATIRREAHQRNASAAALSSCI